MKPGPILHLQDFEKILQSCRDVGFVSVLTGTLSQLEKKTGELRVLEWLSPPLQQQRTVRLKIEMIASLIQKGRFRAIQVTGAEPSTIPLPIKKDTLDWYLVNSGELQEALLGAGAVVETGKLHPSPLQWMTEWDWITKPIRSLSPLRGAITAFTDAGKKSRRAAVTWKQQGQWRQHLLDADARDSLQTLELLAVVWAMMNLKGPLNIVTDSLYVAGVAARVLYWGRGYLCVSSPTGPLWIPAKWTRAVPDAEDRRGLVTGGQREGAQQTDADIAALFATPPALL